MRNMATVGGNLLQRTRCGYFTDVTKPCNKRVPRQRLPRVEGEHHNHAVLGASGHCVAVHPSDMGVALTAFDAVVSYETADGPGQSPLADFYLPVGDTPHRETVLPPVRAHHPRHPAARAGRRPLALPQGSANAPSYAFAIGSVAAALDVGGGVVRESRLASGPWRPGPGGPRRRTRAERRPATAEYFAAAADAELAAARPLPDNGYKVTLMRNLVVAVLSESRRGGRPMTTATTGAVGTAHTRVEGRDKVTGAARYAGEIPSRPRPRLAGAVHRRPRADPVRETGPVLGMRACSPSCTTERPAPRHRLRRHAGRSADPTAAVFQNDRVPHAGWPVALVVAETPEQAREAAEALVVHLRAEPHDIELFAGRPDAYGGGRTHARGDGEGRPGGRTRRLRPTWWTWSTPREEHLRHDGAARGDRPVGRRPARGRRLQPGTTWVADELARMFSLDASAVRVRSEHIGGGFGSKGLRAHQVSAVMAATALQRPVRVVLTRRPDVLAHRLPQPHRPAGPARRRPRRPAARPRAPFTEPDVDGLGVRRAERRGGARDVRRRRPPHLERGGAAGRAVPDVDARAGRGARVVRAGGGVRRTGRAVRHRPGRAAACATIPSAARSPDCRSPAATSPPASARAPAGSAGRTATRVRGRAAKGAGCSAPARPRPPSPRAPCRRRPR
ncbi:hypothetical protein GCM10023238_00590 [Streptomyces heliomycini]